MKRGHDPNFEPIRRPYRHEHADPALEALKQKAKRELAKQRLARPGRRKTGPQK